MNIPTTQAPPTSSLAGFSPSYFALVMATGILAIASWFVGLHHIAHGLFAFNLLAYVVIGSLQLTRLLRFPRAVLADLVSHDRGCGFLTIVAATSLVGSGFHLFLGWNTVALVLWFVAIGFWAGILYAWFAVLVMVEPKPALDHGINGGWFLLTVSTQSLAILGTFVADQFSSPQIAVFACLVLYLLGAMFYLWVIGLVLLRWFFYSMDSREALSPNYWINSGAMAITTMAGARLIVTTGPHVESLANFLFALNLLFWATATWWIPLLFLVGAWRLFIQRFPLRYEPGYWSMVFPLGMYAASTWAYAETSPALAFLKPLSCLGLGIAWLAWALTLLGTGKVIWREERSDRFDRSDRSV